jgi:hypothetical protein
MRTMLTIGPRLTARTKARGHGDGTPACVGLTDIGSRHAGHRSPQNAGGGSTLMCATDHAAKGSAAGRASSA